MQRLELWLHGRERPAQLGLTRCDRVHALLGPLVVPDPADTTTPLRVGDRVRVIDGARAGQDGVVVRIRGPLPTEARGYIYLYDVEFDGQQVAFIPREAIVFGYRPRSR